MGSVDPAFKPIDKDRSAFHIWRIEVRGFVGFHVRYLLFHSLFLLPFIFISSKSDSSLYMSTFIVTRERDVAPW